jgi:hypothetical protein
MLGYRSRADAESSGGDDLASPAGFIAVRTMWATSDGHMLEAGAPASLP